MAPVQKANFQLPVVADGPLYGFSILFLKSLPLQYSWDKAVNTNMRKVPTVEVENINAIRRIENKGGRA